jgi:hypothetical protein
MIDDVQSIVRSCPRCGEEFEPTKAWQRFCSTRCRVNSAAHARYADAGKMRRVLRSAMINLPAVETYFAELPGWTPDAIEARRKLDTVLKSIKRVLR